MVTKEVKYLMCGIAGFLEFSTRKSDQHDLQRMANSILSRGPDGSGVWTDPVHGVGLAHRRLSVIDLSSAGHQPMECDLGRYVITFNGEIYNHSSLRSSLAEVGLAPHWRGQSDTETLLAGFNAWGIQETVKRSIGMFAFAVWDRNEQVLTLGRDRMGEKPLYYGWQNNRGYSTFLFGSDLKSLEQHPAFRNEINRDSVSLLMRYGYIPAPHSIYTGIYKLNAGCLLEIRSSTSDPQLSQYWSLQRVAINGSRSKDYSSPDEIATRLDVLLSSSVKQQMVADVPLGAFLSGGIDSTTIVALMCAQSSHRVKTFTIGFDEIGYNEAVHAKNIARYLDTDHTELYLSADQALQVIPKLPQLYSEPFGDSSQIPTFLISELARTRVTVSLSGDGGDELFAGYNRYVMTSQLWDRVSLLPVRMRKLLADALQSTSPETLNAIFENFRKIVPRASFGRNFGEKLHKAADVICAKNTCELYRNLISQWDPNSLVIGGGEQFARYELLENSELDPVERMMVMDGMMYLPDDVLTKVDRATMGVSLEGRMPFLDHRIVEYAWSLPQSVKLKQNIGKWILREVLYRYVPKELVERPKMGFGIPLGSWLRGPLRDWAENLLDPSGIKNEGYLHPEPIHRKWKEHLSGKRNWQSQLWTVLMFQAWLRR